jgi:hypothetical protein
MAIIYEIVNITNNAKYIGSSIQRNNKLRWMRHKKDLKNNHHHSIHLQRAWNKYGKINFIFNIIETFDNITQKELFAIEQKYLDDRKLNYPVNLNYNVNWVASGGNTSGMITDETRKKMSDSHKGIIVSQETKDRLSEAHANRLNRTYKLISPTGIVYEFNNIRKFSRENNLTCTAVGQLVRGINHYHKGWIRDYLHSFSFISPDGIKYEKIIDLTKFCNEHNLRMKGMSKLHCGSVKSYFGWVNA